MNTLINPFTTTIPELSSVTEKYKFISTGQFIEDMSSLGYELKTTSQPRRGLGMHSMSFGHSRMPQVPGLEYRIKATNSHNGTSAFRLYIEMLVQVCSNGLCAFRPEWSASVVHRGYALEKLSKAVEQVQNKVEHVQSTVALLEQSTPSVEAVSAFLIEASKLRDAKPFKLSDLQIARHREQSINNAWNVYNRTQEALIKGGYTTQKDVVNTQGNVIGYIPGNRAREVNSIAERLHINKELWTIANKVLTTK